MGVPWASVFRVAAAVSSDPMPTAHIVLGESPALTPECDGLRLRWLWLAWIVSLPLLLLFAGSPSCARTQEARVLETGWEMAQRGESWLLPVSNGILRLQKPPIPYWMAALGFDIGGVNEWAGRMPTILVTWLTLGLAGLMACRLFNARAGLLTLGLLLTTYEIFRFGRLAETDAPVALAVTLAIWAFWRASEGGTLGQRIAWNWLAGAGIGLALMSKGGPAVFPVLFLIGWSAANCTWRYIVDFLRMGGWVAFLAIGLPWYVYLYSTVGLEVIWKELHVVTQGDDHGLPWYAAGYLLLQATAPWCAVVIVALIETGRQCRHDRRLMLMGVWTLSILVPLTLIGNKQIHYLFPLMPPVMILCAWLTDAGFRESSPARVRKHVPRLLLGTIWLSVLAGPGLLFGASKTMGALDHADWALAGMTLGGVIVSLLVVRRYGLLKGIAVYCLVLAVLLANLFGSWGTRLSGSAVRDVGQEVVARYRSGPYYFWANSPDLSMVFAMRSVCVGGTDEQALRVWLRANPEGVVLMASNAEKAIRRNKTNPVPAFLSELETIGYGQNRMKVFASRQ